MSPYILAGLGLVLLFAVFKIFSLPIRLIFKLLLNTVLGFLALILCNYLGGYIGIPIGINWPNALVVGVLGPSGLALLLLLRWLLVT